MQTITINNHSYSFNEVKNSAYSIHDEYSTFVLNFCSEWLNGCNEFVFNTSGSTGVPKEVVAQRSQMRSSAQATIQALNLTSTENIYLCISAKMIGGAMMLVRALELGCNITIVSPTSNPFEQLNENHPYTLASFVPMQLYDAVTNFTLHNKLNRFSKILLGGAPASDNIITFLSTLKVKTWQTYGMTETLSHVALKLIGVDKYYTALPGVVFKQDERNCLCIESEITNNTWLITNDLINLISPTQFELIGRIDDVINSGGIKIFTYDVEQAIQRKLNELEIPPKPMFVCSKPDEKYGEVVVVIMLGKPLHETIQNKITEYCKEILGKYAAPKHYYAVSEFERLESGKVDKKKTLKTILNKLPNS